jgi:hypothetical protein
MLALLLVPWILTGLADEARAQFMQHGSNEREGMIALDRLRTESGWGALVRVEAGNVELRWIAPRTDLMEYGVPESATWPAEFPRAELRPEGREFVRLVCAGPAGVGRLLVGGVTGDDVGRLLVFGLHEGLDAELPPTLRLRRALDFDTVFDGALAGRSPVGVMQRYGEPGHALVFTAPKGELFELDIEGILEGRSDVAGPRLVLTAGPDYREDSAWDSVHTEVDRVSGAQYVFQEEMRGCGVLTTRTFVDVALSGMLVERPDGIDWPEPLVDFHFYGEAIFRLEDHGVPVSPRFEGSPSKSAGIQNADAFFTAAGDRPLIRGERGSRELVLVWNWEEDRKPSVRQVFTLPAPLETWAPVGPGLLAVQTHEPFAGVGRLELYRIEAPVRADDPDLGPMLFEPELVRLLHTAADYADERILAILGNRLEAAWGKEAFVLLGGTSTLCRVDLAREIQPLVPVLTYEQQTALAAKINAVWSRVDANGRPAYFFADRPTGFCGVGGSVELILLDADGDGAPDAPGLDRDQTAPYFDALRKDG